MRSPTSVQATDMDWLLCFSLMLTHLLLTDSLEKTEISLTQRQREIWRKTGQKRSGNPVNGSQHVGLGTALTVTRHVKTMTWHILLYSSFVLLVIYSTAIVTLIILKKHSCNICCRRMGKIDKQKESTKKTRFHSVLQEMNNRMDLDRSEHAPGQNGVQAEVSLVAECCG
ncbi:unnamed protein product [Pleuronectes platessa]|uniref:Uncharacterized protein n=1 Tax=Pleuronectes platessa TaxID=8262 RepID=A0A9N7UVE5_PLEPL|nr:unnamed protein product [Pleuronectes platessa]